MRENLVEMMREESESEHVAYTEFILSYRQGVERLYCFYEGLEDKRYYGVRIRHVTQNEYKNFTCGGKDKVYKAYELIKGKEEYRNVKSLFFIDKDFSLQTITNELYCLPCYSVENLYSNIDVLKIILNDEFELDENHQDFSIATNLFERIQNEFHAQTIFFNAWLACQSDIRESTGIKTHLKIDKVVKRYFESIVNPDLVSISNFNDLNDLQILEGLFPDAPKVAEEDLDAKILEFQNEPKWRIFRGKFELKMFISFLSRLKDEIGKRNSTIFSERHKCNLRFEVATAISALSQYALEPECLIEFLRKHNNAA